MRRNRTIGTGCSAPVNPIEFQRKWIGVDLKERSAAQEHCLDLCQVLGHPTPAEMDRQGDYFMFERGAGKAKGPKVNPLVIQ